MKDTQEKDDVTNDTAGGPVLRWGVTVHGDVEIQEARAGRIAAKIVVRAGQLPELEVSYTSESIADTVTDAKREAEVELRRLYEMLKCFEPVARWESAFAGSKRLSLLGWECHVNTSRWTVYHPETGTTFETFVSNSLEGNMAECERVLRSFGLRFCSELPP